MVESPVGHPSRLTLAKTCEIWPQVLRVGRFSPRRHAPERVISSVTGEAVTPGSRWYCPGWWEIPGTLTKNGEVHRVPLSAPTAAILREQRTRISDGVPWVFANELGTYCAGTFNVRRRSWKWGGSAEGVENIRPSDLRVLPRGVVE